MRLPYRVAQRRAVGFFPRRHHANRAPGHAALLAGPGSDGIMVTWKDNFDSFYSEVAELGRYAVNPRVPPERAACRA